MPEFVRRVELPVSAATAFRFHADVRNVQLVTPPTAQVRVVRGGGPARENGEFEVEVSSLGIVCRWVGRWAEVREPFLLRDTTSMAWLPEWEHRHEFRPLGEERCEMTDRVRFRLGGMLGPLMGRLAPAFLPGIFLYRHHATRRALAAGLEPSASTSGGEPAL